jgi:hypothetical protein
MTQQRVTGTQVRLLAAILALAAGSVAAVVAILLLRTVLG